MPATAGQTVRWTGQAVGSAANWSEANGEYTAYVGLRVLVVPPQINAKTTKTVTLRDRQKVKERERKRKGSGTKEWKKFAKAEHNSCRSCQDIQYKEYVIE